MSEPNRRYLSLDQFRPLAGVPKEHAGDGLVVMLPRVAEVRAIGEAGSRQIEFAISLPTLDREQDTVALDGWDFTNYKKNPVVLWAHDHYAPPIGRGLDVRIDGTRVLSTAEFTPEDLNPFGFMIYRMYEGGFMRAVSVGFQPREYNYADDRKWGVNFIKQELLEYSACPVPAHPDALAVARSKGINLAPMREWAERVLDESTSGAGKLSSDQRGRLEILRAQTGPTGRALILELGDLKIPAKAAPAAPPAGDPPPPASNGVKAVTRFECKAGHLHDDEPAAIACGELRAGLEAQRDNLKAIPETFTKTGRVLSTANEERIRMAVQNLDEVLVQLDKAPEVDDDGDEVDDDKALEGGNVLRMAPPAAEEKEAEIDFDLGDPPAAPGADAGAIIRMSDDELAAAISAGASEAIDRAVRTLSGRVD